MNKNMTTIAHLENSNMKLYKSGNIDPRALDKLDSFNFNETIEKLLLIRLNHFIKTIDANTPDVLDRFVSNLSKIHDTHLKNAKLMDYSEKISHYCEKLTLLS